MGNRKKILETIKLMNEFNYINEITGTGSVGSYRAPLSPGFKLWDKSSIEPYVERLNGYENAEIYVDALDGNITTKDVEKKERRSEKIAKKLKNNPVSNDDDGDNLNNDNFKTKLVKKLFKSNVNEADTSISAGEYSGPIEIGLKKWRKSELGPFTEFSNHESNEKKKQKKLKNNIKKIVGMWEEHPEDGYDIPTHDVNTIKEDLGVWFGTKKKPKGSKQPKGPWVNICRKKEGGGHPPCGRPEADSKGYPKCRAAGVASKMTDAQKKSACAQKRRAEKTNPKTGTGNKPKMVSYKPKKKTNESIIISLIRKSLD